MQQNNLVKEKIGRAYNALGDFDYKAGEYA